MEQREATQIEDPEMPYQNRYYTISILFFLVHTILCSDIVLYKMHR